MWIPLLVNFDLGVESSIAANDTVAHCPRLWQGSDFDSGFSVTVGGAPYDFSQHDFTLRVVNKSGSIVLQCGNECVSGDDQGNISIAIPASISAPLSLPTATRLVNGTPLNDLWYSLDAVGKVNSDTIRVSQGVFVIAQDVSPAI